jgi:predicted phage terminase large subunit-like protein
MSDNGFIVKFRDAPLILRKDTSEALRKAIEAQEKEQKRLRLAQLKDLEWAAECRSSFKYFVAEFWDLIEPGTELISAKHIDAICDVMQAFGRDLIKRLVINIPPGHAKSNLISVLFPAWMWLVNPSWSALFGTYESSLAERDSKRTREVIKSERYQKILRLLNQSWTIKHDTDTLDLFANTASGFRMTAGSRGRGTGWRVDCVVADDPLNSIDAKSKAARDHAHYWLTKSLSSRHKNPRNAKILVIMQRLHVDDPSGHLLRTGTFEHLCLPSEFNPAKRSVVRDVDKNIVWSDWRKEKGELLFPELYTREVLDLARKTMGSEAYEGQHNQNPTPPEGGTFKKRYWRFWRADGQGEKCPRPDGCYDGDARVAPSQFDNIVISLDAAFKDGKNNDYVAFVVVGVKGADRYVLHVTRRKLSFTDTVSEMRRLCSLYPHAFKKLVEDKANGTAVINTLQSEIAGIIAIEPQGGKESRAAAAQPQIESGNVYIKDGAPWVDDFVQEFADFPLGSHDDQVDALCQALIYLMNSPALTRAIAMSKW